jgi:hypothetical protein
VVASRWHPDLSSPQPAPAAKEEEPEIAALTLFEFWSDGHPPNLLRIILEYWRDHGRGCLRTVVTRRFLLHFAYVFNGFENTPGSPIRWAEIDPEDEAVLEAAKDYANGIGAHAEKLPDHVLHPSVGFLLGTPGKVFRALSRTPHPAHEPR